MSNTRNSPSTWLVFLAAVGVLAGMLFRDRVEQYWAPMPAASQDTATAVPSAAELAAPHLQWADDASERALDEQLRGVVRFFDAAKRNTRAFAQDALGWGSKWRLMADYVPFTRGGRHETFLRQQFDARIFSAADFERALQQAIAGYLAELRSIDAQMLVKLRADAADFPSAFALSHYDEAQIREHYEHLFAQIVQNTNSQLRPEIATELASLIAGEVLTQVAVRLGVSAGILGAGGASSWMTLGVGVVVGVIVDQIVSWIWDWYADPKGSLAAVIDGRLDEIRRLVIEGSTDVQGLRTRLRDVARQRAAVRSSAVLELLQAN